MSKELDFVMSAVCCLQTSIRGAFLAEAETAEPGCYVPPPSKIYLTDQPDTPFCLSHSFANVRYMGSEIDRLTQAPSDCLTGFTERFEIIVGTCSPPPPSIRNMHGDSCDPGTVYGECPPCGETIPLPNLYHPETACVLPVLTPDGGFDWPKESVGALSVTHTQFAAYLLKQRWILRKNFLQIFCKCMATCAPEYKGQAKFSLESVGSWCDGPFQGTRLVVVGNIE